MNRFLMLIYIITCVAGMDSKAKDKFITVAVIDTGLSPNIIEQNYAKGVCKMGHKDFTGTGIQDDNGHGTNVAGLIHRGAKGVNYCMVILKFYSDESSSRMNMERMLAAIKYAINLKVDFINISGGGPGFNIEEKIHIIRALDRGITIVSSAGNEKCELGKNHDCEYYPAQYDPRIIVVGNGITKNKRFPGSNWGSIVDVWINGSNVVGEYGVPMTGTSQATAIHTGRLVRQRVQGR